jgi:hypothetical protein
MTTAELERERDDELVLTWRRDELLRAGYGKRAALVIALDGTIDLHLATDLIRRGCPERTALRILL